MHSTVQARAKLHAAIEDPGSSLDARIAAGEELARLGDDFGLSSVGPPEYAPGINDSGTC